MTPWSLYRALLLNRAHRVSRRVLVKISALCSTANAVSSALIEGEFTWEEGREREREGEKEKSFGGKCTVCVTANTLKSHPTSFRLHYLDAESLRLHPKWYPITFTEHYF